MKDDSEKAASLRIAEAFSPLFTELEVQVYTRSAWDLNWKC
jgi:hypothetical protein